MTPATTPFATLLTRHFSTVTHYQPDLVRFLLPYAPRTIVETGTGLSTLHLLNMLDQLTALDPTDTKPERRLYSVDVCLNDSYALCGYEVAHPRYELIRAPSTKALAPLAERTGRWDVFLHDSDHGYACQTFEYEFALQNVRPGGWIFTDDFSWEGHGAWHAFIVRHNLHEVEVAAARGCRVPVAS